MLAAQTVSSGLGTSVIYMLAAQTVSSGLGTSVIYMLAALFSARLCVPQRPVRMSHAATTRFCT
jgi:hypothetical protein